MFADSLNHYATQKNIIQVASDTRHLKLFNHVSIT